jgi:hypothetical protein
MCHLRVKNNLYAHVKLGLNFLSIHLVSFNCRELLVEDFNLIKTELVLKPDRVSLQESWFYIPSMLGSNLGRQVIRT